jgi:hypothetical protein
MTILSTAAADAVDVDGSGWDVSLALEIGPHPMRMIVVLIFCGIIFPRSASSWGRMA